MRCAEALSGSLRKVDSSVRVGGVGVETKQVDVTYDPTKVTLHQLAQAVAETEPIHGKPYQAGVVIKIEDPKTASKVPGALKKVKGVTGVTTPPGLSPGEVAITVAPLPRQTKPADQVKASQIADALEKAGVKFSGLDASGGGSGTPFGEQDKKKPAAKGTAKPKPGEDMPPEKSKPARTPSITPKTKPAREPSSPDKSKEGAEDKPRFEIQGEAGGKYYLVDHETKTEEGKVLKKFVKVGDKFGDYIVKEAGDDDGLFIVLEHSETKETVRVEHEKKDKEKDKDGDKPKEEKPAKPKDDAEKEKKDKDN